MPTISLKGRIAGWRRLLAAANAHEVEIPQIGPLVAALEEALDDVTAAKDRQGTLKHLLRETGQELKAQTSLGSEMAMRLKFLVRAALGRKDERLADFGMKPLGRPRKRTQAERRQNGSPGYH